MTGRLGGKVAAVTGAAGGLGHEIARLYAREGAKVVVADMREDGGVETVSIVREEGSDGIFVPTDVRHSSDLERLVATAEREFGKLNIMTANAGIQGRAGGISITDVDEDDFSEVMEVNFGGVWRAFRYAIPAIRRAGAGAMTATSSVSADRGFANLDAYCASKAAVNGLVRSLSAGFMSQEPRIRVNAVSAGSMDTDFILHMMQAKGLGSEEIAKRTAAPSAPPPYPRAEPLHVAHAHLFLASDDASFVGGQVYVVDGGWSVITNMTPAVPQPATAI